MDGTFDVPSQENGSVTVTDMPETTVVVAGTEQPSVMPEFVKISPAGHDDVVDVVVVTTQVDPLRIPVKQVYLAGVPGVAGVYTVTPAGVVTREHWLPETDQPDGHEPGVYVADMCNVL